MRIRDRLDLGKILHIALDHPIVKRWLFRIATERLLGHHPLRSRRQRRKAIQPLWLANSHGAGAQGSYSAIELCWHMATRKLSFSGQSLVPVLVDGGRVVNDSWNIACYLDEAYPDRPKLMEGCAGTLLC